MQFMINIKRRRKFFQRKSNLTKAIEELDAFQRSWMELYENHQRVLARLKEIEHTHK